MKKFWRNFKLRLSLFRIWFVKNILVFLQTLLIVVLICMFTGAIRPDTPLIGPALNTIFGGLIEEIREVIEARKIDNFMTFLTVILSVITTVGMFAIKAKSIAQSDIKSDKMKIAMIQAKLYFNSDGKLKKRIEKATQTDLDGDGVAGDVGEATVSGNIFTGIFSAIKEFFVIATAKFDDDPDNNEEEKKEILKKANLEEAAEGQEELFDKAKEDATAMVADEIRGEMVNAAAAAAADDTLSEEDKAAKITFFGKLSQWFQNKKEAAKEKSAAKKEARLQKKMEKPKKQSSISVSDSPSVDVIVNNIENDAKDSIEKTQETVTERIENTVMATSQPVTEIHTEKQIANSKMEVDDFLNNMRKTKR